MADDINKKIAIDVQVSSGGQQQIDQYKNSFDNLRTSLNALSKPLSDLSKNIGSLNTDMVRLAAVNEKFAAKLADTSKKAADQQAKSLTASNQALKTSMSEADKINEQALIDQLASRYKYYGMMAATESEQYAEQKSKLDDLLKQKGLTQAMYDQQAEQMLKDHYAKLQQIVDQYVKDNNDSQALLAASGLNSIVAPNASTQNVKQVQLVKLPTPKPGFFQPLINGFKSAFTSILSYYKKNENAKSKATVDAVNKTNATVAAADKTAMDKKLSGAIDNATKIENTISDIVTKAIDARAKKTLSNLEDQKNKELANTSLTADGKQRIETKYKNQEDAVKKKAFLQTQRIAIGQALINGAIAITKAEADLGPIAGTIAIAAIVANTAVQIASIAKQKPQFAKGGYFVSDGKGAALPGYSRSDDTNAYLRSGEGIVVSEAMRDPWARNMVSAINVAYGGRDFSVPAYSKGYAVGGIFTDGGNANRYYNQPMNDNKNLANTIAYQMINNFPPVYVDVKDINNQQNILAQTVNRVNL
jgi:hypothetical protein